VRLRRALRRPLTDAEAVLATEVSRYLLESERVVIAVRRHPAQLLEPVASAVAALLVALWLDPHVPAGVPVVVDVVWLAWAAVTARSAWKLLEWRKDWFLATDRRLLLTHGLLTHKVAMMPLIKVTDMSYNRSIPGRVLGYGEFILESAGQEQALRRVQWVPNPDVLYRAICREMFGPGTDRRSPGKVPRRRRADVHEAVTERIDWARFDEPPQ
jgi:membrane protein YdbS with pleckstrin-like domain